MIDLAALPPALLTIATRPLCAFRATVRPMISFGATPNGERRVGVVTGGRFEGERLSGNILDGGSDWQTVRPDGSVKLDVKLILETDDGVAIGMGYVGVRRGPPEVLARPGKGEAVDPSEYYFRTNVTFETSSEKYAFLNGMLVIGTGHRFVEGPVYNLFEVL